ncbi:hypothetical protein OROMI_016856 [Orobanche minor]
MDLETENRIAALLRKEAVELRRQAQSEGSLAYLRQPIVTSRPNSRFLTAIVRGVQQVPKVCSSHAIKNWPHILGCSINKMRLMVQQFAEMDLKSKKLGQLIATSPRLLLRKPQEFAQKEHWVLLVICLQKRYVHVFDPVNTGKRKYDIKAHLNTTFKAYQIAKGRPKQTKTLSWNNEKELNGTTTSYLEEENNEIRDVVADYLVRNLQK